MKKTTQQKTVMKKSEYCDMYKVEEKLWWFRGLRQVLDYYVKRLATMQPTILDAGCGTGMNMQYFQSKGIDIKGIDISPEAVRLSKKRGIQNTEEGSIAQIPYKDHSFDVVLTMDVLGLLPEQAVEISLNEMYRVLKPGGYLIIQCAAFEWLRSQHDDVSNVRKRFTKKEFERFFSKKKWKIVKSSYRIFLLFPLIGLYKLIKKLTREITHKSSGDLKLPPAPINNVLLTIQTVENWLLRIVNFPIGSSLFIITQKY